MSRAFVKETDHEDDGLPERVISSHPNFVTASGLKQLEDRVRELEQQRSLARAESDVGQLARLARELRYFQARRDSARLVKPESSPTAVRFGVLVHLERSDATVVIYRVVGEDESNPAQGLLSYVSPLAQQLLGLSIGDEVLMGKEPAWVTKLEG